MIHLPKKNRTTGICFDAQGVAVAEVLGAESQPVLTKWAWAPIDSDAEEHRAKALRQLFAEYGFSRKRIIACLPQKTILFRTLDLPPASDAETLAMAMLQARKALPLASEGMDVECEILAEGNTRRVALIMARRRDTEQLFSTLSGAGIRPDIILPESHALLAAFRGGDIPEERMSLVHGDGERGILLFVRNGKLVFARVLHLTELDDAKLVEDQLLHQWRSSFDSLEGFGGTPTKILLTGGAALSPPLAERFRREISCSVESSDPFSIAARLSGAPESMDGQSCAIMALGAAMSEKSRVNLLPRAEKLRRVKIVRRMEWTHAAAAGILFCLSLGALASQKIYSAHRRLQVLDARLAVLKNENREAERMLNDIRRVQENRTARNHVLETLAGLTQSLGGISLTALDYKQNDEIMIQASGRSFADAAGWVQKLSQDKTFGRVMLRSSSTRDKSGQSGVDFEAEGDMPSHGKNHLAQS